MNLQQLWFVKYDSWVLTEGFGREEASKLAQALPVQLPGCGDSDIQLHMYELLRDLDDFLEVQRITTMYLMQSESCTQQDLLSAESAIMSMRLQLQHQKLYAVELWLNRKLDWNVEIRLLATLCRLYQLLRSIHCFLVGPFEHLWQRSKAKRLIVPLDLTEKFVNRVYRRLCRAEEFYYRHEYPYIKEIHIFLESYRKILTGFHKLTKQQIQHHFSIFDIVLMENKKYVRMLTQKNILRNYGEESKKQDQIKRERKMSQELPKKREIDFALEYAFRKRRTNSQKNICRTEQETKRPIIQIPPINLIERKKTLYSNSIGRSNTQYTSKNAETRTNIKDSVSSIRQVQGSVKSRRSSRKKLGSRRTIDQKSKSRTIVRQESNNLKVQFREDVLVETQSPSNQIKSFYENFKDKNQQPVLKVAVNLRDKPSKRTGELLQVSSKFDFIQKRAEAALLSNNLAIKKPKSSVQQRPTCY